MTRDVSYTLEVPLGLDGIHICNSSKNFWNNLDTKEKPKTEVKHVEEDPNNALAGSLEQHSSCTPFL